ncbi:YSIRK-type signal peptide-containing protein [Streptococcus hyointestinalis]
MKKIDPKRTTLKRQEHFSIRKFKYGVASVLIETGLLFSPGVVAKASETTATSNPETPVLTIDDNDTTTASSSQEIIAEATETAASSSTTAAEVAETTASTSNEETSTETTADKRIDAEVSASGVVTFADGTAVQTVTLNGGATSYPVDGGTFVITGTTVSFISNGTTDATYTVTVEAYDADGNKDTETYSVTAKKSESSEISALEAEEVATEETATEIATETTTLENVSVSNALKAEEVTIEQAAIEQDATEQTMMALALDDTNAEEANNVLAVAATSATATTTSSATTSGTTDNDYRTDKAIITETVEEIAEVTAANPTLNNDHYTKYADYNLNDLKQQIAWLNLNDASVTITDAEGNSIEPGSVNTLSVGMTFTQELVPGYTVVVTVTGLQPFQASDVFRQRLIDAGLDPDDPEVRERTGYDPDDYNRYAVLMKDSDDKTYPTEAPVILSTPDSYSSGRTYGYDTGDLDGDGNRTDWTAIGVGSPTGSVVGGDGGAVGIQLNIKAYNAAGEQVPANIIMMDNEEVGTNEFTAYTTDGEGWELIYELSNENVAGSYTPLGTRLGLSEYGATMGVDYSLRYFKDKDGNYLSEKSDPLTTSQGGP